MRKSSLIKVLAMVVCVFMFATVVVGCGSSSDKSTSTAAPASSAAPTASTAAAPTSDADLSGSILLWHFNQSDGPTLQKALQTEFPKVKIDLQVTIDTNLAYQTKLTAALRSGSGVPDIIPAESAFVTRFVNLADCYDDLSAAPYNAKDVTGKMVPYTVQIGTDTKGVLRALSHQATPGAVGYKRDMATKYLGTDDPAKISDMISTPDKMLEVAKTLSDKSGGKAKLIPSQDELYQMARGARADAWVKDNKLILDPMMTTFIDVMKKVRDGKYDAGKKAWQNPWTASFADDVTFMYAIPTWGIPYIIATNDKANVDKGRWGLAKGPWSYFWGGTWFGVYSKSQNKELAWRLVKWYTSDPDHLKAWAKQTGDFINNTDLIGELGNDDSFINKTVNQNPYKVWTADDVAKINGALFTDKDDTINLAFQTATDDFFNGTTKTKEDAIKKFKDAVKAKYPDLTIE
ncbi:MAG: extracellular solute-binding protein [Bacillota bacterium]|nr:extracellular solute-binding protein [Bacillota bacterium]